jgi:dCTP deaminase
MHQIQEATILSDRQIRELCIPPTFIVSEQLRVPHARNAAGGPLFQIREVFSWKTQDELDQIVRRWRATRPDNYEGIVAYRNLTDKQKAEFKPMISPFSPVQVRTREVWSVQDSTHGRDVYNTEKIVSWGLTSFGYDVRCGREFKIFTNINSTVVDPKHFDSDSFVDFVGDVCIIPPNSFVLARTMERFDIPRNIVADCLGKSTYARCGISIMVTPLEPEWDGFLTLEFANTTPLPAKLYAGEGCGQIRFFRGSEPCEVSYKDRGGKYQGQDALPTVPKV